MKNKIKYLIISILFVSSGIMFLTTYFEINSHGKSYKTNIKNLENLTIKAYKESMEKNVKKSILFMDVMFNDIIENKENILNTHIKKLLELNKSGNSIDTLLNIYNKDILLKKGVLESKPFVFKELNINDNKFTLYIKNKTIKNELLNKIRKIFYFVDKKNKRYMWINEILDYKGGKDYAIRVLHANLKDTEGKKLSTLDYDIFGNRPYLDELNGINDKGELFSKYFFKELNSDTVSEKVSYSKLYPKLNWVVSTGIPLNRLENIIKNKQAFLEVEYQEHFKKVIILNSFTLMLFFVLLSYLYRKISKFMKENLLLEKEILENKINKKYQKELEKKEEQYRYLMEATQDGVWDWNLISNEVYYSTSLKSMLGYTDDEFESHYEKWYEKIHPDDKALVDKEIEFNISGKSEFYSAIYRLKHKDNSWVWIDDKGKVFFNESGKAVRMVGSHRDITKEKYYHDLMLKKEKQFSELFYNNRSMLLVMDPETLNILNSNKSAEEFYGYTHLEFKKKNASDINIKGKIAVSKIINSVIDNGFGENLAKHKLKSGEIVNVKVFSTPTRYDGKVAIFAIIQDVTEEFVAKKTLDKTINLLEKTKENLDFAQKQYHIGSWELNKEEGTIFLSSEVYSILEIEEKELSYKEYINFIHPSDKQDVLDNFDEVIKNKTDHEMKYRLLLNNGKIKYIKETGKCFYDENGKLLRVAGTLYDTTRNTLIESNWKSFFSLSLNILLITDFDGNIIKINPASHEILGYEPDELMGKNLFDYIYKTDVEISHNTLDEMVQGKNIYNFENRFVHKNGKTISLAWSGVASKESNSIYAIAQDISELKKKNYVLSQQSKMASMGEMLGNIAHQWRQPLSLISTLSTGMKLKKELDVLSSDEFYEAMDNINNTTQFLSQTIDDFRKFFQHNKDKTEFLINDVFDKTLKIVSAQFTNHDILIIKDISDTQVLALENELLQVLINILNNARDALLEKREDKRLIFINVYEEKEDLIIKIKDNASGIPLDIIDKVFEPYFSTKHQQQGTGIGLYMSEEIVTKHLDGKIEVENVEYSYESEEYKGAEFTISLPL
ncbi:PAS domain-containing protein [Poseidonibacter lekithochrous]|uniref:PAS domain-containing protein n=1 Tax=Poseidonibacter lekithochrous TaxID=1904463 RepID=UPI0008FC3CA3|nr:PAS domain-containing protein [Poseidonibacter lekithochrous]QKJ22130.1 multi-sensor domain-containing signal transduction histidine kinase [Poseidonibacter lekithochrous]